MRSIRFSIKGLLLSVTLVAVGTVALLNASPLWSSVVVSITLLVLLTSLLAVLYDRDEARSFWAGSWLVSSTRCRPWIPWR